MTLQRSPHGVFVQSPHGVFNRMGEADSSPPPSRQIFSIVMIAGQSLDEYVKVEEIWEPGSYYVSQHLKDLQVDWYWKMGEGMDRFTEDVLAYRAARDALLAEFPRVRVIVAEAIFPFVEVGVPYRTRIIASGLWEDRTALFNVWGRVTRGVWFLSGGFATQIGRINTHPKLTVPVYDAAGALPTGFQDLSGQAAFPAGPHDGTVIVCSTQNESPWTGPWNADALIGRLIEHYAAINPSAPVTVIANNSKRWIAGFTDGLGKIRGWLG